MVPFAGKEPKRSPEHVSNDFPYTQASSRLADIFASIGTAGTPPKFNNEFLKSTLGYTSSNDRAIIPILRALGFISPGGEPTQRYNDFKGHDGGRALAAGLREGWAPLFMADQEIYKKQIADIQKRVVTITGANENLANRVASTFAKLCEIADWSGGEEKRAETKNGADGSGGSGSGDGGGAGSDGGKGETGTSFAAGSLQLHQDIHIHLPATSDPAVYRAVFQAIKSELT